MFYARYTHICYITPFHTILPFRLKLLYWHLTLNSCVRKRSVLVYCCCMTFWTLLLLLPWKLSLLNFNNVLLKNQKPKTKNRFAICAESSRTPSWSSSFDNCRIDHRWVSQRGSFSKMQEFLNSTQTRKSHVGVSWQTTPSFYSLKEETYQDQTVISHWYKAPLVSRDLWSSLLCSSCILSLVSGHANSCFVILSNILCSM